MKRNIISLLLLSASVLLNSCGNFLDEMPDNRAQIDNVDKIKALLVSAYPNRFYASSIEARGDGIIDHGSTLNGQLAPSFSFNFTNFKWDEFSTTESADDMENYWGASYAAIAAANHALEAIEKLGTPQESLPYKAEALLCRAYSHFTLLTLFANFFDEANRTTNPGIPYMVKPETVINGQYDRETVDATLAKVKADVVEGMKHIGTAAAYEQPKFHFTLNAARLLSIRIALFERNYNDVIALTTQLLPQVAVYGTVVDDEDKPILNGDGTETKVPRPDDMAYLTCQSSFFDWISATKTATSVFSVGLKFTNVANSNIILASEPYSLLDRVVASNAAVRYTYSNAAFTKIIQKNASGSDWSFPVFTMGSSAMATSPSVVPKTYEDFKLSDINSSSGTPHVRVILFRLEEAILARAEAFAMTGKYDEALADLTMYSQKRTKSEELIDFYFSRDKVVDFYKKELDGVSPFVNNNFNASRFTTNFSNYEGRLQRGLLMAVLDARRTEYINEGMRWFDILRWNIPVKHVLKSGSTSTLTPDDDRRVIQIPQTAALSGIEGNRYTNIPHPWN